MSFKLHKNAPQFFRHLLAGSGAKFDTQFDVYYHCLMCGLDKRLLGTESEVGDEFVRDYVQAYQPHAELIAGLLIDAELMRTQVDVGDVKGVEKRMVELLDPASASRLSAEGMDLLNRYAAGGFNIISDACATAPQSLEEFLVTYYRIWDDAKAGSGECE